VLSGGFDQLQRMHSKSCLWFGVFLSGKEGHVLLGDVVVPDSVLRGRGLRALWEAQQGGTAGGLMQGGWVSSTRQAAYCSAPL
jgi:hypothetical protein